MTEPASRFPDDVRTILLKAGWFEGRDVLDQIRLPGDVPMFPAARRIFAEFGLIRLGKLVKPEPLGETDLYIDPGDEETDLHGDVILYEPILGSRLYPLGETGISQGAIYADEQGRIWLDFNADLLPFAPNFDIALIEHIRSELPSKEDWKRWGMAAIPHIDHPNYVEPPIDNSIEYGANGFYDVSHDGRKHTDYRNANGTFSRSFFYKHDCVLVSRPKCSRCKEAPVKAIVIPSGLRWRQGNYLAGKSLSRRPYTPPGPDWDHDHCPFCWAKFMRAGRPGTLHEGYATDDEYHWICPECVARFRDEFEWTVHG